MTALTPQQMRALASRLPSLPQVEAWLLVDEIAAALHGGADEVDRLRAERDSSQQRAGDLYDMFLAQVDATTGLRATIQNAPHDKDRCNAWWPEYTRPCTCWKADVL